MTRSESNERPRCVLVGVQLPGVDDVEHEASLAELGRLCKTLGLEVVGSVSQKRTSLAAGAVLGEGKLKELSAWTGGKGVIPTAAPVRTNKAREKREGSDDEDESPEAHAADDDADESDDASEGAAHAPSAGGKHRATVIAVDHEISPSQARNLERATDAEVLDRAGVIVEIFHRHAQSREAKLQVEIARLTYLAPRLREQGAGGDRVRGGVGGKGAGESAVELDRRKIRDRIAELREELGSVQHEQDTRRARRRDQLRVALVGYTNAGKSSLMRALTGSEVYVADKLFATLDTTVRALHPETRPRILISDTVGFIKKLPHDLVASFRSTLSEALEASLLLYVVDAADPTHRSQLEVTREVLREIGATDVPSRLVLNKIDRLSEDELAALREEYPDAIFLSAHARGDVHKLRDVIMSFFERDAVEETIVVPYDVQGVIGEIHASARVLEETYDEQGAHFRLRAHPDTLARLKSLLER